MLVQQGAAGVAAVLAIPVGVNEEIRGGQLGEKTRYRAVVTSSPGIAAATCSPTTYMVPAPWKAHQEAPLPVARGRYVLSNTQT